MLKTPQINAALSLLFVMSTRSSAGEMYFVSEDARSMSMLTVEAVRAYSEKESLVPFWLMSAQKTSSVDEKRMVARHQLVAVCNLKQRQPGSGNILTTTGRYIAYEAPGQPDKVLVDDRFSTPQTVDRNFTAAYDAAIIACAKARYL